ncbi:hypothetical protein K432DRAFT_385441 [Lepidopterella palustris CBS 459.81]|uniref:Leucine rich repeat domain protein n=1 Tax=Lepidopterella palustris CBS 459.81 TaxID=1314670 RepID=A0A8E2JBZ4_9PEZI|nr:hypothetical protein K432DRAFT_385441 [Lepidopterella palustris CBS 459.81]
MEQKQDDDLPDLPLWPEHPSSPPLPPQYPTTFSIRKRSRSAHNDTPHTSSDPPVFSSDDLPEASGIDNYTGHGKRKKRRYQGTWWSHGTPEQKTQPKGEFARNLDSGVWMASDDTEAASLEGETFYEEHAAYQHPWALEDQDLAEEEKEDNVPSTVYSSFREEEIGEGELLARKVIEKGLEAGAEQIDLSNLSLTSLSDDTLRPLHSLVRYPRVHNTAPSPEQYDAFTPSIQLFLSGNALRSLPPEMWSLQNITVLSLRNNGLTELPPCIAQLKNLFELNVSGNRLRWLPWELLDLLRSGEGRRRLIARPNPFFEGVDFQDYPSKLTILVKEENRASPVDALTNQVESLKSELAATASSCPRRGIQLAWIIKFHEAMLDMFSRAFQAWVKRGVQSSETLFDAICNYKDKTLFIAATKPSFFAFDGTLEQTSPMRPSSIPTGTTLLPTAVTCSAGTFGPVITHAAPPNNIKTPSLLELALQSSTSLLTNDQIAASIIDIPRSIQHGLDAAASIQTSDGALTRTCSVCSRNYIIARTEWIEFWHYSSGGLLYPTEEPFLPFLRRGCSWGCVLE